MDGPASKRNEADRSGIVAALSGAEVFSTLSDEERGAIAEHAVARTLGSRRVVFWQGDPCTHLHVVVEGAVKLTVGAEQRQNVLDFVGPGGVFGEEAVFSGDDHQTTASTLARTVLIAIEAAPFSRLAQHAPRAAWAMLNGLSRRVTRLSRHMERLTSLSAEQRLAAYLLSGAHVFADGNGRWRGRASGVDTAVGPSRRDLASHLAVTPETLSRTIAIFRSRSWIEAGRRGISVTDEAALASLLPD